MKRAGILPLAIFFATTGVYAQNAVVRSNSLVLASPPRSMDQNNCPVGLRVKHGHEFSLSLAASDGSSQAGPAINGRAVGDRSAPGKEKPGLGQQINLTTTNLLPQEIVRLEITAHGYSKKGRLFEASSAANTPDLTRKVEVALDVKGNGSASRDLSLRYFAAVTSVDLNAITYADGSTWQATSPGVCSVTPDLLMLVDAQPR